MTHMIFSILFNMGISNTHKRADQPFKTAFIARKRQKAVTACKPTVVLFLLQLQQEKEPQNNYFS